MQNNPQKSRALIITFIIVLGLLIGLYFVFTSNTLFGVDNSIGKKFSPFLITPKEKGLNQIEDPNTSDQNNGGLNTNNDLNPDGSIIADNGIGAINNGFSGNIGSGGNKADKYTSPTGGSITLPGGNTTVTQTNFTPQCSDKIDNDGDKLIDALDPGCHSDGDASNNKTYNKNQYLEYNFIPACSDGVDNDSDKLIDTLDPACHSDGNAKNTTTYTPEYTSEYTQQKDPTKKTNQCTQDDLALVFTAEEQAELDELTRQFYRIAPSLKSTNDILIEEKAKNSYIDLVNDATKLTTECYEQTYNDKYLANSDNTLTEGFELLNTRNENKTITIGSTKYELNYVIPELNNQDGKFVNDINSIKESSELSIPISPYASLSDLNKGRTERRLNPYIYTSSKPRSSYWQIFETKQATKDPHVNYYGFNYDKTAIGSKYFPWSDWEDMMGIW